MCEGGDGMEEWKECKLKDICDYGKGRTEVSSLDNSTYISTENMLPNRAGITTATTLPTGEYTPSFEIDDTLVSNIRPYFKKIWKATFSGGCSADVLVFKAKENVSKEYLYYVLADDEFFKYSMTTSKGTKMPRGDKTSIMNYPIKLPPLPTQQKIAAILSSLDDKIELNNKININLEQQAQALFKNWFVDFEPFGGKMPEEWKEKTLDSFCSIFTGRKNANASVENGKYKFFTCSPNVLPIDSFIFDGDAIIISGNGAYTGRTRFYSGKFDLYQRTYACTMKKDQNQDYIFILYWIIKFVLSKKIMGGTHGSAIPYIVMDDIAKFVINYDKKLFDDLSKIMKSYVLQIQENENQNEKLAELRDTLLPKLMNGEINI